MSQDLIKLIQASGNAGSTGQSFANHVTGSGAGVGMLDYSISGSVSWTGQPLPPNEQTYNSGQTFSLVGTFSQYGSKWPLIRRNGATNPPWNVRGSVTTTINSITWNDEASTVTAGVTTFGEYDQNTVPTLNSLFFYYTQYNPPDIPPDNNEYVVRIRVDATGGGSASGYDDLTLELGYLPDTALFNPTLITPTWDIRINKRALPSWSTIHDVEGYTDNTYTTPKALQFLSDNNTTYDAYVRYRIKAEYNGGVVGDWVNYGQVTWTDPRADG